VYWRRVMNGSFGYAVARKKRENFSILEKFIKETRCEEEIGIQLLEKADWDIPTALEIFRTWNQDELAKCVLQVVFLLEKVLKMNTFCRELENFQIIMPFLFEEWIFAEK
jgi:hypothetical protein